MHEAPSLGFQGISLVGEVIVIEGLASGWQFPCRAASGHSLHLPQPDVCFHPYFLEACYRWLGYLPWWRTPAQIEKRAKSQREVAGKCALESAAVVVAAFCCNEGRRWCRW